MLMTRWEQNGTKAMFRNNLSILLGKQICKIKEVEHLLKERLNPEEAGEDKSSPIDNVGSKRN